MLKSDLTTKIFNQISQYVMTNCGINLSMSKFELVNTRLSKVIRAHDFSGFKEYYQYLTNDNSGEALNELMNAISTNLTSFYRESSHFEFMQQTMLPDIIKNANNSKNYNLRGWSAGCSLGAEIYTIAITLFENIPDLGLWDAKLLATDIDTNVLNTGEQGIYTSKQIEGIPSKLLSKYFQYSQRKTSYKAKSLLRNLIRFRYLNLIEPFPFKQHFDFIFCRNVMIYFTKETQQELVNNFYKFLRPGGYLFIGHSEGLSGLKHKYKYVQPTIYKKK